MDDLLSWVPLGILFLAAISLTYVIRTWRRNKRKESIDAVSELLSYLQSKRFIIIYDVQSSRLNAGETINVTVPEISNMHKQNHRAIGASFDNEPVLIRGNNESIIDERFLNNAHMPKKIADAISLFFASQPSMIERATLPNGARSVKVTEGIIKQGQAEPNPDPYFQNRATAYMSWLSFKDSASTLMDEIMKFLKSSGESVNTRYDNQKRILN